MKRRGMNWTLRGPQAMAKVRELVTNGTLAPWCRATTPTVALSPHHSGRLTGVSDAPLPWPQVACPAAHGPPRDPAVAHLQRVVQGGYRLG